MNGNSIYSFRTNHSREFSADSPRALDKFALKRRKEAFLREKKHLMKKKCIFFRLALNLFFVMTSNY